MSDQTKEWYECKKEYICENNLQFGSEVRIDYDSRDSFHNWVAPDKLNLTCVGSVQQGAMGSFYFLGFAISCGIVPYIADLYGRKKPVFWSMFA